MSIFEDKPAEAQTNEALATEATTQETPPQESFVSKLVETRGEKWGDPEVIAKGKLEADAYVKTLEEQLAQMREDLGKQDYASQLLTQLQQKAPSPTVGNTVASNNNNESGTYADDNTNQPVDDELLKSLVEKTLTEREAKATVDQNLSVVVTQLEELYGTEANATVQKKAQELGMTLERIEELAKESPSAFFALLGENRVPAKSLAHTSIRTEGVNYENTGQRDWAYYSQLRRENKNAYYTPKVQQQLLEDKQRLGSKFGA
tara:strand:- start:136 stop:921 length:786 start_codon:yes stop_codon:yes gene_type:complete